MGKRFLVISTLAVTGVFVILCAADSTYATGNSASVNFAANIVTNTTLSVNIDSVAGENVIINLAPTPGTTAFQDSDDVAVTVTSNNRTGYYLMMSTSSENLTNTADDTLHISSLDPANTTGYTSSTFPANAWGYSTKAGNNYNNFFGVGNGVMLQNGNNPTQATSTVKFGIKVDSNLPSGVYTTSIVFTTIAKPALYMQDVAYWKDSIAIGESVQAIDNRDMKSYWVTRIKTDPAIPDGRAECTGTGVSRVCSQLWMTQNLDLDLTAGTKTFTHTDTDLGWSNNDKDVVWTSQIATYTYVSDFLWAQNKEELSFDFGDKYMYGNIAQYNSLQQCLDAGLTKEECEHYHSGNLYNFYAATVQSATSGSDPIAISNDTYTVMPNSICPAGWRLPAGLTQDGVYSDVDFALHYNGVTATNSATLREEIGYTTTDGYTEMISQPFWFTTAGGISQDRVHYHVLNGGLYWYDTIAQENLAERLFFSPDAAYPALTGQRAFGHAVRCIAR